MSDNSLVNYSRQLVLEYTINSRLREEVENVHSESCLN